MLIDILFKLVYDYVNGTSTLYQTEQGNAMGKFDKKSADNFTEELMTAEDVWRERIALQLENADTRILKIVYYFIVGLKKKEARLGR